MCPHQTNHYPASTPLRLLTGLLLLTGAAGIKAASTPLADQPIFGTISVPGNLLLSLSVEYPTAVDIANYSSYAPATAFLGNFDAGKCYTYYYNLLDPNAPYFKPAALANATHGCTPGLQQWSGSFLNWATTQTIDPLRVAMTGGYRAIDTPSLSVVERAWASGDGGSGEAPNRNLSATTLGQADVSSITPFKWASIGLRIYGTGNQLYFTNAGAATPGNFSAYGNYTTTSHPLDYIPPVTPLDGAVAEVAVRVQVCDTSVSLESNCTQYGKNYKPEGLMQQYALNMRFGAFGYLNDSSASRDGGVLRGRMAFVGPQVPVTGQPNATNPAPEWSATTGVFLINPDPTDAAATTGVSQSGVINYLNKFGEASHSYKAYDPVSELYGAGIRYFKHIGNVPEYTNNLNSTMIDGFPVITNWEDPILYACQQNFILGIGDVNTHYDGNDPGTSLPDGSPAIPALITSDTSVNSTKSTNQVGLLEGLGTLGTKVVSDHATYYMAGLAYDSHTVDMRPNDFLQYQTNGKKTFIQTESTYWLDVQEYQQYYYQNQFWLAAKYGGFQVPNNYSPYGNTTPLSSTLWDPSGATDVNGKLTPANYFPAGRPDLLVAGLKSAFASIVAQISAGSSVLGAVSPQQQASGNIAYGATYSAKDWSGTLTASLLSYDSSGNATLVPVWEAGSTLTKTNWKTRVLATSKGAGTRPGVTYSAASLTPANLTALTVPWAPSNTAQDVLNYLAGDRTNEVGGTGTGAFRARNTLLGDIVDAKTAVTGPPSQNFSESSNPGYASFVSTYAARPTIVYAAANDGFLHAFDASITDGKLGVEYFAYLPSLIINGPTSTPFVNGVAELSNPSYVHNNYVDESPSVYDVDFGHAGTASAGAPDWHSILIGGLGKGGKGYFAIDVTDPSGFKNTSQALTTSTLLASNVLWEFTDPRMGYSYGEPVVVKTPKYGWVVVFTSGYNNVDGNGYLFFVNPKTGALLEAVATGAGSSDNPSGFTFAEAFIRDYTDFTADSIYGGDLLGNIWRFDLTPTNGSYSPPTLLATLTSPAGDVQAVTTRPLIQIDPTTGIRYVMFGTGRLLANSDIVSSQVQTFYAIMDGNAALFSTVGKPFTRGSLAQDTNDLTGTKLTSSNSGWLIDLPLNNGIAGRVNVDPTATNGTVAFAVNFPGGDACSPSGSSYLYALSYAAGKTKLTTSDRLTPIAYTAIQSGLVTDLVFFNVAGTVFLEAGTDQKTVVDATGIFRNSTSITPLNWHEVQTTN